MIKTILTATVVLLLASSAPAQEKQGAGPYQHETPFETDINLGYRWIIQSGNPMAGEYQWQHSSPAGSALIEWDPLPNRFRLETIVESGKEYFGELDYSYGDIVMLNVLSRSLFHNIDHYSLGQDDPATSSPSFSDFNAADRYGVQDAMNRAQVRFKTPDFPLHLYLEAKNQEKRGTVQQFFLRSFSGGFNKASQSRQVDWETEEAKATINSHAGPIEIEYSHAEKQFKDLGDKVLTDTTAVAYTHNQVPEIESSSDTVKIHTSHTGRIAAAATFSTGERENKDSFAKTKFTNAAGDLTVIPTKNLTIAVRYRHFDVSAENPDTVTSTGLLGTTTYTVKDALSYQKDQMSGLVRYRATQNLTLRVEAAWESLTREKSEQWDLVQDITKTTARFGATYRFTSRLHLRGDVSRQTASVSGGSKDNTYPDTRDEARGMFTWVPASWFNLLLSGGTIIERRDSMAAPFAGARETIRNRALGSMTFIVGKKTSITPSYALFQNRQTSGIAYTDALGAVTTETDVPYADTAHTAAVSVSHAATDIVLLTAEASRTWSRGNWRTAETVPGSAGIPELSGMKVVESVAGADVQVSYTKNIGSELRYQYRKLNDLNDQTQDGTNQIVLATLSVKW